MTDPWPLLADLDALLSRDGWQEDAHRQDRFQLLREIAWQTRIGPQPRPEAFSWSGQWPPDCLDFLGSRDAAAMLREAVMAYDAALWLEHLTHRINGELRHVYRYPVLDISCANAVEAAADTRAALEAGWRIGLWPVRREG